MSTRLDIGRGAIVEVGGRLFKVTDDSIAFGQVEARDLEFGRIERLAIGDIRRPNDDEEERSPPALPILDSAEIEEARRRLAVIGPLVEHRRHSNSEVQAAAAALGISKTTLYRWMNQYATDGRLTSLCPRKRPGGRGKSRLEADIDRIVQSVIDEHYLKPIQPTAQSTIREVNRRCRNANLVPPHSNTIRARLKSIPRKVALKSRGHKKEARDRFTARPGHFELATHPLSLVQVDHTPLDLVLVDERFRMSLHRPFLTLVFDVYSRMILSFYISFEKPNALATGIAIARAIMPKDKWLLLNGIQEPWPCWGFPKIIHVDNAKEFRGEMLRLACEQYKIEIDFRPVADPAMGGHIERVLGTIMRQHVHEIAGAAKKPVIRGEYDSDKNASMTLAEFEVGLTKYITGIYHQQYHSGIGTTPIKRWTDALLGSGDVAGSGQPAPPKDEERLRIDFMPVEKRGISKEGVRIDNIFYFHDALRPYIGDSKKDGKQHIFHRDPRDISVIYFWDPAVNQYISVPYKNATHPPISVWELNVVRRHLEAQGRAFVNEQVIFATYEWLRAHAERSQHQTRVARRNNERRAQLERSKQPELKNVTPAIKSTDSTKMLEAHTDQAPRSTRFEFIKPLEMDEDA
jgi:putative transposase